MTNDTCRPVTPMKFTEYSSILLVVYSCDHVLRIKNELSFLPWGPLSSNKCCLYEPAPPNIISLCKSPIYFFTLLPLPLITFPCVNTTKQSDIPLLSTVRDLLPCLLIFTSKCPASAEELLSLQWIIYVCILPWLTFYDFTCCFSKHHHYYARNHNHSCLSLTHIQI